MCNWQMAGFTLITAQKQDDDSAVLYRSFGNQFPKANFLV